MAPPREFRRPMARTNGRRRVLLAHDLGAPTCDSLLSAIDDAFNDVEVVEVASAPDAQGALERSRFDACFVCLDLPPAPLAGVRLAQAALRSSAREGSSGRQRRAPSIVLVTRSLRWLPPSAAELRSLPWVAPDASAEEIAKAVDEATRRVPSAPTSGWDTRPSADAGETSEVMLAGGAEEAPRARRRRGR